MRLSLACLSAGLLTGCADSATSPNTAYFGGAWHYVETLGSVSSGVSCADTGVYRLDQMGAAFNGDYVQRGVCSVPGGVVNNADSGIVAGGKVVGRTIRFTADLVCDYDGLFDEGAGKITGRVVCLLQNSVTLAGTWSATR